MSEPIVFVDTSEIRPGKLGELKEAISDLVAFVESHEPRPISYNVFIDERGTRMTVLQVHPDSASMQFHMRVAGPAFSGFADLLELSTMDVYGDPSDAVLDQLRRKVDLLGDATIAVHERHGGFFRSTTSD